MRGELVSSMWSQPGTDHSTIAAINVLKSLEADATRRDEEV